MTDRDIPPGLSALPRRRRTHPESLAAQRAVLGRDGNDAGLRGLAEQAPSEPAIALLDAWAVRPRYMLVRSLDGLPAHVQALMAAVQAHHAPG